MEQTIDRTGSVVVGTGTDHVTWDVNWTHYGTSSYILEQIALRFTMGSVSGYNVKVSEQAGGTWSSRLDAMNAASSGTTVTLPLSSRAWDGKTAGTLRALFYKRGSSQATYNSVSFVFTYRAAATASTVTVVRTMAGQPQTVQISNTDPDVTHRVTWSYGSYNGNAVTSGEQTYGAATRSPAWAVPAADLQWLYWQNPDSATETGTVTVKTYTADGTLVGSTTADAVLDLPETADTRPAILLLSDGDILDATAQAIYAETDNPYVQGHTTLVRTVTAEGYAGAGIARIEMVTPDGTVSAQNGAAASMLIRTPGSYAVEIRIIDTRGQITTWNDGTYTVQGYINPVITSIQAVRCDGQGTEQPDGGHAWVEAVGVVTGETEVLTATIRAKGGSQIGSAVTLVNGTALLPSTGTLNEDTSYVITVTLEDAYGVTGTAEIELGTGTITISRMAGGKGVAFGKAAERYGVEIDSDWPFYAHGQEIVRLILDTVYPPGTVLSHIDPAFDPNTQWPWTRWGQVGGDWVRGV